MVSRSAAKPSGRGNRTYIRSAPRAAQKFVRGEIRAAVDLRVVDDPALRAPQRHEDFRERAAQVRRLRREGENVIAYAERMQVGQRAAVFVLDLLNIEPDVVEPAGIHLAQRFLERWMVHLAARDISVVQHTRHVVFAQICFLIFDQRARHPPCPLADVVVGDLLAQNLRYQSRSGWPAKGIAMEVNLMRRSTLNSKPSQRRLRSGDACIKQFRFGVRSSELGVRGFKLWVRGLEFGVRSWGLRVRGFRFWVRSLGFGA